MEHLTSEKKIPLVLPGEEVYLILARETISKHLILVYRQHGMRKVHQKKKKNSYAYNAIQNLQFLNTLRINKKE